MIRLAGSGNSFTWSSTEQEYPLEKALGGETLYAKQFDVGLLPNAGILNISLASENFSEDQIFSLTGFGIKPAPVDAYVPMPFSHGQGAYVISLQAYSNFIQVETFNATWVLYNGYVRVLYTL